MVRPPDAPTSRGSLSFLRWIDSRQSIGGKNRSRKRKNVLPKRRRIDRATPIAGLPTGRSTCHHEAMTEPADLPARESDSGASSATQLSILLASVTSMIEEEFKRSERLDAKSRNQVALVGTFFAVVQAGVIGLINGSLGATEKAPASSFIPWLAVAGGIAGIAL